MMKKHSTATYFVEILLFVLVLALGGAFVYVIDQRLDQKMEDLKVQAIDKLESQLGRKIRYRSISPSVFGFLAVRDLTIFSDINTETVLLKINRVKIYYNVLALLFKKDPINALSEIQVSNSVFRIEQDRDAELIEFLIEFISTLKLAELGQALKLSGVNINLTYITDDGRVELSRLFFSIASSADFYKLNLRCSILYEQQAEYGAFLSSRIKLKGRVDQALTWSDLSVRVFSLATHLFSVRRQTLQINYRENTLEVRKIQDRAPFDIQLLFDLGSQELTLQFQSENFQPSKLFNLQGAMEKYNNLLSNRISAAGTIHYALDSGALDYRLDFAAEVKDPRLPFSLDLVTHLYGDERVVFLEPFSLNSEQGRVEFFGNVLLENYFPAGFLKLEDIQSIPGRRLNASFTLARAGRSLSVFGSRLTIGTTSFENMELEIRPHKREFEFSIATSLRSHVSNQVAAAGKLSLKPNVRLEMDLDLDDVVLSTLYRLVTAPGDYSYQTDRRLQPYLASSSLSLQTDFTDIVFSSSDVEISDRFNPENRLRFAVEGNQQQLELDRIVLDWQGYSGLGRLRAQFERDKTSFELLLNVEGYPYDLKGFVAPGREIHVEGAYGLDATFRNRKQERLLSYPDRREWVWGQPVQLLLDEFPLPLKSGTVYISTDISGVVTPEGQLSIASKYTNLENILLLPRLSKNSLELSFTLQDDLLELHEISYRDRFSSIRGKGSFQIDSFRPPAGTGKVILRDRDNVEMYSLAGSFRDGDVVVDLMFQAAPLERFGEFIIRGDLSGSAKISGELSQPVISGDLELENGRINIDPISLSFGFDWAEEKLTVEALNLSYFTHRLEHGQGMFDLPGGVFSFTAGYRARYFERKVGLNIDLEGGFDSSLAKLTKDAFFNSDTEGSLRFWGITVDEENVADWVIRFSAREGILALEGGPENGIRAQITKENEFTLSLLAPLPIRGKGRGSIQADRVGAAFDIEWFDMQVINTLTYPNEIFSFSGGYAYGSLNITGLVTDPDFYGILDVVDAEVDFAYSPDSVKPIDGRLVFNEKTFTMERLSSSAGRAQVSGEGVFYMDHWIPVAFELLFEVERNPGIRISNKFGTVSADGYVSGRVRVFGDETFTQVEGDLTMETCRIVLEKGEEEVVDPDDPTLFVKINLQTGKRVEFYWPSIVFPILHTYAKQGEKVSLVYDGDKEIFSMNGNIEIRGGEIFYFDRSFYLKKGSVNFEETFDELDPRIVALAEIRERDQNNEEIRIYLEVNNRLSQFTPRFYSEPSRSDVEILNYIGGALVGDYGRETLGRSAVMLTSDLVSQFGIIAPFERAVRDILGLDLFSIRTQVVQNILIDRLNVFNTQNDSKNVWESLDNTTLSLGKYLGTDLFLEMSFRVQSVDTPTALSDEGSQLEMESELNFEWTTPFFLMEWSFAPKHPEDLYITDNSIGFTWKFSY